MSVELECGGGLLLLRHVTPLTRRDVVYFHSGAHRHTWLMRDAPKKRCVSHTHGSEKQVRGTHVQPDFELFVMDARGPGRTVKHEDSSRKISYTGTSCRISRWP